MIFLRKRFYTAFCGMLAVLIFLLAVPSHSNENSVNNKNVSYKLGAGDRLKINVFGEESLSGEFEIDGQGVVALPLLGNIKAGGNDVRQLEIDMVAKLKDGYLVNPRVSVEVLNFRPFFILGEVRSPGSYPYVNGLKVLNAVALSGGYTYRARTDRVLIRHGGEPKEKEFEAGEDSRVMPGDVIMVTERFF